MTPMDKGNEHTVVCERLQIRAKGERELLFELERESDPALRECYEALIRRLREAPDAEQWLAYREIVLNDGTPVGLISFAGPPEDGTVELGYGVFLPFEGQGYATEAVAAMSAWCLNQPEVNCVMAETEPENTASRRVLEKCGFVPVSEQNGVLRYERH